MPIILSSDGVNRQAKSIPLSVNGTNVNAKSAWAGVGGVNQRVFSSGNCRIEAVPPQFIATNIHMSLFASSEYQYARLSITNDEIVAKWTAGDASTVYDHCTNLGEITSYTGAQKQWVRNIVIAFRVFLDEPICIEDLKTAELTIQNVFIQKVRQIYYDAVNLIGICLPDKNNFEESYGKPSTDGSDFWALRYGAITCPDGSSYNTCQTNKTVSTYSQLCVKNLINSFIVQIELDDGVYNSFCARIPNGSICYNGITWRWHT